MRAVLVAILTVLAVIGLWVLPGIVLAWCVFKDVMQAALGKEEARDGVCARCRKVVRSGEQAAWLTLDTGERRYVHLDTRCNRARIEEGVMARLVTQLNLGGQDCVERAVERMRYKAPPEGYILCFSGGKDSCALKAVADIAGVKYEPHYHVTTIDPPPVLSFMRKHHPDVVFDRPKYDTSFAQEVPRRGFPLRTRRWCCEVFKERRFPGRILLWGKRQAERRASGSVRSEQVCHRSQDIARNPLFDWSDTEVWSFLRSRAIPYCRLYDEGWKRIGCICCPFASASEIARNRARWPAMFRAIRRGFAVRWEYWQANKLTYGFHSAEELFEAWLRRDGKFANREEPDGLW